MSSIPADTGERIEGGGTCGEMARPEDGTTSGYGEVMTRDEAIRVGTITLGRWHNVEHGSRCACSDRKQLGGQVAALVDALNAGGVVFDKYTECVSRPFGSPNYREAVR